MEFSIYRADTFWAVFVGMGIGWTGAYCVKQTMVQRYCCFDSPSKARKYSTYCLLLYVIITNYNPIEYYIGIFRVL